MIKDRIVDKIIKTESSANSVFEDKGRIYTFLNPVSYLDAEKHVELFDSIDGIFADGALVVKAIRLVYHARVEKREFDMSSMAKSLFNYAVENDKTIYIIASKDEEIENAVEKIKKSFPNLRLLGYRSGYFMDSQEYEEAISRVISLSPDYLIVGMGAIKQEEFLVKTKNAGFKGIGFTCGAFITQIANYASGVDFFPDWAVRFNVRFIYRIFKEPHTRKRYLKAGVVFPFKFLCNKWGLAKS